MNTPLNDIYKRIYYRFTGRTELRKSSRIRSQEGEASENRSKFSMGLLPGVGDGNSLNGSSTNTQSAYYDPTKSQPIVDLHLR